MIQIKEKQFYKEITYIHPLVFQKTQRSHIENLETGKKDKATINEAYVL